MKLVTIRRGIIALSIVGVLAAPSLLAAQEYVAVELLNEQAMSRLNDTARQYYEVGIGLIDRVDMPGALAQFERASEAQPGHIELAFIVAEMAKRRARREFGDDSERYYRMALTATERILRRTDLDATTAHRAEQGKSALERELRDRDTRDERRLNAGLQVNLEVALSLGLEPQVLLGSPARQNNDPRAPFIVKTLSGGPTGVGLGPPLIQQPPAGAASPFGSPAGAPSPFGAPPASGSPFGAPASPNPFGAPAAPGTAPASPFGSPAAGTPNPFAPAAPASDTTAASPFGG